MNRPPAEEIQIEPTPAMDRHNGRLLAFGILGAGELGGAYFPNYVVSISSAASAARNLSLLTLVSPVSGIGPIAHGAPADLLEKWTFRV